MPGALCVRCGASSGGTTHYLYVLECMRTTKTARRAHPAQFPNALRGSLAIAMEQPNRTGMAMQRSGADAAEEEID